MVEMVAASGQRRGDSPMIIRVYLSMPILLLAALIGPKWVLACDCLPQSEAEQFASADLVFTGKAVQVVRSEGLQLRTVFQVDDLEKGDVANGRVLMHSSEDHGGCGYGFIQGLHYRVLASEFEGRYRTGDCSGNSRVLEGPDRDLDGLPDLWEAQHGFNPNDPRDAGDDVDGDGLTAFEEYVHGTHPSLPDTDGDRFLDGLETSFDLDPLDPESPGDKPIAMSPGMMEHVKRWRRLEFQFEIPPAYQLGFQVSRDLKSWRASKIYLGHDRASSRVVLRSNPSCYYRAVLTPLDDFYVLPGHRGRNRFEEGVEIELTDQMPITLQRRAFDLIDAWIVDESLYIALRHSSPQGGDLRVWMDRSFIDGEPTDVDLYVQLNESDCQGDGENVMWRRSVRLDLGSVLSLVNQGDIVFRVHGYASGDVMGAPVETVRFKRE